MDVVIFGNLENQHTLASMFRVNDEVLITCLGFHAETKGIIIDIYESYRREYRTKVYGKEGVYFFYESELELIKRPEIMPGYIPCSSCRESITVNQTGVCCDCKAS